MEQAWALLVEVGNDIEAEIIIGFLRDKGIPARKSDSSPYTGAMRVIGGIPLEVQVFVPENWLEEASKMLNDLEGGSIQ